MPTRLSFSIPFLQQTGLPQTVTCVLGKQIANQMKFISALLTGGFSGEIYKRIIGGHDCAPQEANHRVSLCGAHCSEVSDIICGGTLIRPRWVLTSAKCNQTTLRVISSVGHTYNISQNAITEIQNKLLHGDIMLLQLTAVIPNRTPVGEPNSAQCQSRQQPLQFVFAGLGISRTEETPDEYCTCRPLNLQCITVQKIPCHPPTNTNRFCATTQGGTTQPMDYGGGLVNNRVVYGVLTYTDSSARSGHAYSIYENVCNSQNWIHHNAV
ncbi:trypsin-like [Arapaima gigas]